MKVSYKLIGENFYKYFDDDNFINILSKEEICQILDFANLSTEEFTVFFHRLSERFGFHDLFDILQHVIVDFEDDFESVRIVLNTLGKSFDIHIFTAISDTIRRIIKGRREVRSEKETENSKKLKTIPKLSENFEKIYKLMSKAADENDESTIIESISNRYYEVKNKFGDSILLTAALKDNLKLIKLLHKNGADIKMEDNSGSNILHMFAASNNVEGVKFSLEFFDVNSRNGNQLTPLHFAAGNGSSEVCEVLLNVKGIDKDPKDSDGVTPLGLAVSFGKEETIRILKQHNCQSDIIFAI